MMNIRPVKINVADQRLRANLYTPEMTNGKALLFIHGWNGRANDHAAEFLVQKGYFVLTLNLRGHNGSDGNIEEVSRKDGLEDAVAGYDFLKQNTPVNTKIIAVGNSYGGYMTSILSTERKLYGLSIRVPANYPDEGFELVQWGKGHEDPEIMNWRNSVVQYNDNRALDALHNFTGPIQIIEAENDDMVPHQVVQNYTDSVADTSQLEYLFMKGWPHSLSNDKTRNEQFKEILLSWLEQIK